MAAAPAAQNGVFAMTKKQKKMLVRILITAVMLIALHFISITGIPQLLAYVAAYLVIGYDILRKAGKGILNGRAFDENFLMALATLGAFFLAIWTKSGDYVEGIAVMLFYQIGELFQSYAVGKSRKNISALMDIRPDYANIEADGQLTQVEPDEVPVGSMIVVQPGEKVPLDGVIVEGTASLNTSALTGESLPRDVKEGDEIISGCINQTGLLFYNTLFDENACCHLALGMGFADTIKDFQNKTLDECRKLGVNDSMIHEDFMIGSADLAIDAVCEDGKTVAIFRDGTWAF